MSQLCIRSLSILVLGSHYFKDLNDVVFVNFYNHFVIVNGSDWQNADDGMVLLPLVPLGFENHALKAVELLERAILKLEHPSPVKSLDVVENLQMDRDIHFHKSVGNTRDVNIDSQRPVHGLIESKSILIFGNVFLSLKFQILVLLESRCV